MKGGWAEQTGDPMVRDLSQTSGRAMPGALTAGRAAARAAPTSAAVHHNALECALLEWRAGSTGWKAEPGPALAGARIARNKTIKRHESDKAARKSGQKWPKVAKLKKFAAPRAMGDQASYMGNKIIGRPSPGGSARSATSVFGRLPLLWLAIEHDAPASFHSHHQRDQPAWFKYHEGGTAGGTALSRGTGASRAVQP